MMAVSADAMGDVITTSATIFSVVFLKLTGYNIDGFIGLGVSLVVMWAGVGIAKDTLEPLIGRGGRSGSLCYRSRILWKNMTV